MRIPRRSVIIAYTETLSLFSFQHPIYAEISTRYQQDITLDRTTRPFLTRKLLYTSRATKVHVRRRNAEVTSEQS